MITNEENPMGYENQAGPDFAVALALVGFGMPYYILYTCLLLSSVNEYSR